MPAIMFEYISSLDSYDSRLVSDFLGIMSSCLLRPLGKAGERISTLQYLALVVDFARKERKHR